MFIYRSLDDGFEGLSFCYEAILNHEVANCEPSVHSEVRWFDIDQLPNNLAAPVSFALSNYHNRESASMCFDRTCEVVLVQPFFPFADRESLSIPLGLATLHAVLQEASIQTRTYDCSLELDYDRLRAELPRLKPRIIGIQFHSEMSFTWAIRMCRYLRAIYPQAVLIAGGETATFRWRELLDCNVVDYVVREEGEITFVELTKQLLAGDFPSDIQGTVSLNSSKIAGIVPTKREYIRDLDMLPMHAISDLSWRDYGQWTLFTSRGCPFRCSFCSSAEFWRHSVRYQSPSRVCGEISRLQNEFGAKDIYIADDIFTANKARVGEICKLLLNRNIHVRWSCLTRADCVTQDLLNLMAEAGCVLISYGMETSSDNTLRLVEKQILSSQLASALDWSKTAGIRTRVSCIFGLPHETESDIRSTIEFLVYTQPDEVQLYGLTPHDGTALYGDMSTLGIRILQPDPMLWSRNVLRPVCETDELSATKIADLARECIHRLQQKGYFYISDKLKRKKIGAPRTVATSFSPVQSIGSIEHQN